MSPSMRRVVAGISNFTDPGDISTLANPEIVDAVGRAVQIGSRRRFSSDSFVL